MKKYLFIILIAAGLAACEKGEDYRGNNFPGFSGAGESATWVVYNHTVTDISYVTGVLPSQTPPTTYFKLDSTYTASRQKEISAASYKIYKSGEVAVIINNAWVKQPNYKWELAGDQINIYKNNGSTWNVVIVGFQDQEKLLLKFKKSFFGDTSSDKERFVMEVFYTIFK